jgi:type II secretory pathway pseudopilin PulG
MRAHHRQEDCGARERGYALVALLALMTVLMIMMMGAAPSIRQQVRRDVELEAIARGEEVAEAIRMYRRIHPTQQWPNSMDELLDGVAPAGRTKKVKVLRASAARDPLSTSGEWRTVKVNDPAFLRFVKDVTEYNEGRPPVANPRGDPALNGVNLPSVTSLITGLGGGSSDDDGGGEDTSLSSSGAFVGVVSRSKRDSIVTYYGIDRHNRWVFTPFYR